jgi:pimeloyl-ACP methyl ester carboxylesterase
MRSGQLRAGRLATAVAATLLVLAALAPTAMSDVRFERIRGFAAPGTPAKYNKVGILKIGPPRARNVLVLNPGTSASAAYFAPLARDIVRRTRSWQVWAVERRENLLEDHSMINQAKADRVSNQRVFDYYLGFITKGETLIPDHFRFIPDSEVGFAREWGMRVEIEDLRRVVGAAKRRGGKVVVGGHSLGGSITTAYATWDFNGRPGAKGLSGLVYIDGGSNPAPATPDEARQRLGELQTSSPWLTFGGIQAPFAGLFNVVASTGVLRDPDGTSELQTWSALPANLKPSVPTTNIAQYGYALDTETSPPALAAAQAHLGRLEATGARRGWERAGELTPIRRYAKMFSGAGLRGLDGTAWYHPMRLTIDSSAVAAGNANPAQDVLDVRATHGDDLPRRLRIYAFGASLGNTRVLHAARALAAQSGIPRRNLTLVDRHETYAHNDPNSAFPRNDFVARLVPFLASVRRR